MFAASRAWARPCRILGFALAFALAQGPAAAGEDRGILTIQNENDVYNGTGADGDYTNGLLLSYLSPLVREKDHPARWVADRLPFLTSRHLRYGISLGHNIYTPENTFARTRVTTDRPYAGWLYLGFSLLNYDGPDGSTDDGTRLSGDLGMMQSLVLDLGMVGPLAQGERMQNDWHTLFGFPNANGWDHQLGNEPGVNLTYQRLWRLSFAEHLDTALEFDVMPRLGGALGNVATYGAAGATFRVGTGLDRDFGPPRIRPLLTGSGYFAGGGGLDGYAFIGVEGRAVIRDIFLDGNSFGGGHSLEKHHFVGDIQGGVVLTWGNFRLSYTRVYVSPQARGSESHQFGAVSLSWRMAF